MDEFAELFGNLVGLAIILMTVAIAVVFIGMIVAPIGLVGGGTLYYLYNIHGPEKRRREAQHRTKALYAQAQTLSPSFDHLEQALLDAGIESPELHRIAKVLYQQEGLQPPVLPPVGDDPIKLARYQGELERFINAAQPDHYQEFERQLIWALSVYEPDTSDESQMFHSKRQRTKLEIERMILRFVNDDGLFKGLTDQLNENYHAENEVMPSACKHDDYVRRYLKNTPLLPLADVEETVGLQDRMYHTYLLGSSGSGKTNLIENIIAHDLRSDEDCCVIVIDSQTQLIDKLAKLDIPNTTHITPKYDLALNLFDVGYEEMKGRGIEGETLINKTVGLLSFVLEGMMWAEFTNPQKTIFQYVIQLVISIKGGNINTFMDILADGGHERYADEISQLDENMQRFFAVDYPAPDYKRTREAIRRRMDGLLLNPTFRRLFSAIENKIDMFEEMATQKLILIDTNKPMLDDAPSAFFGRLFIALILRASYRRFDGAKTERPVYLIVDEAHEYFDRSISDMLEQARKANIGLIVAHQSISQARGAKGGSNITDPLMVNTATKLIWTSFREDATKFAGSMQVKTEDILALPQFTFGMHSRKQGFAPIKGVAGALADFEKLSDPQELRLEMEKRYGPTSDVDCPEVPQASSSLNGSLDTGHVGIPPKVDVI
ncbi:hypothetical protein [Litoreibacter halocynthiae]|uniref:hypothetical protein n=1 Tax=Litoreibacter halocynthiae TaxID=1242689 RepID=UPI002492DF48|nr:hypothetical protein [Litoreibacter halocynthiae]